MKQIICSVAALFITHSALAMSSFDRVAEIKKEIISISKQNTTNEAGFANTRKDLDLLVAEIQTLSTPVNEVVVGQFSPGSWKQIWSDERNMDVTGGPQRDLDQIYQYVNAAGWAFNFGVRTLPDGRRVTFSLKAQASVIGNEQTTEITEAYLRMTPLTPNESIEAISYQIYEGKSLEFAPREAGRFPNGPIGAIGILSLKFLDNDLKIGTTNNVFTGDSELFVMERMN